MDVPVTERQFLEQLHELSHKIKFVKEQSFHDAIACQDVQEVLEKLRIKVIADDLREHSTIRRWLFK